MAKLNVHQTTRTAEVQIGEETALFTFRNPTIEEMQDFTGSQIIVTGKKIHDRSLMARCDFFDLLLTEIKDLEDGDGNLITAERTEDLPMELKARIVINLFETPNFTVQEKN